MIACSWLLLTAIAGLPQVEVTTLSGDSLTGQLTTLTPQQLEVEQDGKSVRIPTSELLQLQLLSDSVPAPASSNDGQSGAAATVELLDRSRLTARQISSTGDVLAIDHPQLGTFPINKTRVHSVRLAVDDPAVTAAWNEFQEREKKQDYLVIRKGDVLDHLDGVIGALDDTTLKFLLDGDQIDVKRSRVFGWIYATKPQSTTANGPRIVFAGGDSVTAASVAWDGSQWLVSAQGMKTPAALDEKTIRSIDYSAGKVLYLSSIEPRDQEHVPFFGVGGDWPYQRDRNLFGRPLKVGSRTFSRGLALHSKTRLVYRLGGDYRRLTAVAGLDPDLPPNLEPAINNTRLTIRGDKKILFDADIRAGDPPAALDLPVANVIELEILVDFGLADIDIGDRLHLGDLKVLK